MPNTWRQGEPYTSALPDNETIAVTARDASAAIIDTTRIPAGTFAAWPWHVRVDAAEVPFSNVNWGTITAALSTSALSDGSALSSGAQNDEIVYKLPLAAGTWTCSIDFTAGTSRGIFTVQIDGSAVGTIDGYNGTVIYKRDAITGITVAQSAIHAVKLKMATKNASAATYHGSLLAFQFTRTA